MGDTFWIWFPGLDFLRSLFDWHWRGMLKWTRSYVRVWGFLRVYLWSSYLIILNSNVSWGLNFWKLQQSAALFFMDQFLICCVTYWQICGTDPSHVILHSECILSLRCQSINQKQYDLAKRWISNTPIERGDHSHSSTTAEENQPPPSDTKANWRLTAFFTLGINYHVYWIKACHEQSINKLVMKQKMKEILLLL